MKIGIDLDDTLSDTRDKIIKFHNDTYGTILNIDDITSYKLWEIWGGTLKEAVVKINHFHETPYFKEIKPIDGVKEILDHLKKNNELYIITARSYDITEKTEQWVEKYFPNIFSKIYFTNEFSLTGNETTKKKICDDVGIDILIEDNLENVLEFIGPERKAFLLDYPWNQMEVLPKGITRVKSWEEINKLI